MNFIYLLLLSAGLVLIQGLIGGTRLLFSIPTYTLVGTAAVLSIVSLRRPISKPVNSALLATLLFAGYIVARAIFSPNSYLAWPDACMAAGCLIVYLLTALYITESRHRLWIVSVLLAVACGEVAVGLIQFSQENGFMLFGFIRGDTTSRASGMFISGNHFAGYLETVAMLALGIACWGRWRLGGRMVAGYIALVCYVGVAISGSRGGYISSVFSLLVFAALSIRMVGIINRKRVMLVIFGVVAALVVFLAIAGNLMLRSPFVRHRLSLIGAHDVRIYNWQAALDQFRQAPWAGTGAGTHVYYARLFRRPEIQSDPIHAHGDYLELLAEYGIAGEALALFFIVTHLASGLRGGAQIAIRRLRGSFTAPRSDTLALNLGALGAVSALLSHSVVDFNMHIPGNALVFAFIFGMLANPGVQRPEETPPPWGSPITLLRFALLLLGAGSLAAILPKIRGEWLMEQARVALREQKYAECRRFAKAAIAVEPENPQNYFYLGEADRVTALAIRIAPLRRTFFEKAVDAYTEGLKHFPQDENMLIRLAQALDGLHRFDLADEAYQTAIRWDPNLGLLYAYYGAHLRILGLEDAAKQCYDTASKLGTRGARELGMAEAHSVLEAKAATTEAHVEGVEESH